MDEQTKTLHEMRQMALVELASHRNGEVSLAIDSDFPEEFANQLSRREAYNKHLFRPNTYLHKWWARRCGSTFRAILKQFVSHPEQRDYYAPRGLEGKIVLDPMMGGGTTLHEAIRLGANVIGADIDPIPVVQIRASLAQISLQELQATFGGFFQDLHSNVGSYFKTECPHCDATLDAQYTLHGLRKRCACGEVIQIDSYELRHETDRVIRICPDDLSIVEDACQEAGSQNHRRLILKSETSCAQCGQKYQELLDIPYFARYIPIAVVGACPQHGLFFKQPDERDHRRIVEADQHRSKLDFGPLEEFRVESGPKSGDLLRRNVRKYSEVFSSRQLLYLWHAIQLLQCYEGAARINLALLVSTSLEFNSMLCGYKGANKRRPGAIRHTFALHAYSFPYTCAENNPVNPKESSGNLRLLFRDRIKRGRKWSLQPVERKIRPDGKTQLVQIPGEFDGGTEVFNQSELVAGQQNFWLIQGDSRQLLVDDHSVDFIVTDPPYYDSVQYSDLAAFFRVWLAKMLPGEANWTYDTSLSAVATQQSNDDTNFMRVLGGIFGECGRILKHDTGRLVFTFHHWDPNAWAELTIALKQADFRLRNAYVVFSENPISVHINNLRAIKHDAILVLALDGVSQAKRWTPIDSIAAVDSATFCWQCSHALGWMLESALSDAAIRTTWDRAINSDKSRDISKT